MDQPLSARIAAARRAQGLTQQQIANALGVSRAAVGQWESGTTEPSVRNLKALNDLLRYDLSFVHKDPALNEAINISSWRYLHRRNLDKTNHIDFPIDMVCVGAKAECLPITGNEKQPIDYVPRPFALYDDDAAFGVLIATDALYPRFEQEDVIYIGSLEAPAEGEYCLALIVDENAKVKTYIGRIAEKTNVQVTIETFKPASKQVFPLARIAKLYRVMPWNELLNERSDRREETPHT